MLLILNYKSTQSLNLCNYVNCKRNKTNTPTINKHPKTHFMSKITALIMLFSSHNFEIRF